MKRSYIIIIAIVLFLGGCSFTSYNGMVNKKIDVETQWAQVETSYQRRADLIPSLVATVKKYAEFEKSTLTGVVEARSKATSINVNANDLNPAAIAKFQEAQSQLSGALSRLLLTVERYPDLKANQGFSELRAQLEGTENRISTERKRFNEEVGAYNRKVETLPGSIFASLFGFESKGMFKADVGAEKAPDVEALFE